MDESTARMAWTIAETQLDWIHWSRFSVNWSPILSWSMAVALCSLFSLIAFCCLSVWFVFVVCPVG